MKKIWLSCLFVLCIRYSFSQVLFTYATHAVSKDEFLKAYNKNKTAADDQEKALREYLNLYTRFKLKVQAAKAIRLDTTEQLKYDLQNFRSQVEDSYLADDKGIDLLVDEAIQRYQKDIQLYHFSVPVASKAPPADSLKAWQALTEVQKLLKTGNTNYEAIASQAAAKAVAVQAKDLGYITAMLLPYQIENAVYNLKPGEATAIIRTKTAMHIFKHTGERKSVGKWKVAQVLFALPPGAGDEKIKAVKRVADSVYALLKAGASFAETAKIYSDDKLTYLHGGELNEFGTGRYDASFEKPVFALQADGDITEPFLTRHGWHIVKRLQRIPYPVSRAEDENFSYALRQQILKDPRSEKVKEAFAKQVLQLTGYKRNPLIKDELLYRYADSVVANNGLGHYPIDKKVIFSFAKSTVTGADWLHFVKDYKLNHDVYKGEDNPALLQKYIHTASMEYYRKHLEEYNEDFRYQLQEFKEGNMLFDIMEKKVWGKAAADSAGLQQYYTAHKQQYLWAESADVLLLNCADISSAQAAAAALREGKNWQTISDESNGTIQVDSARYELAQLPVTAGTVLKERSITAPVINEADNTASFIQILKLYPAGEQRSFNEARGLVINDYQNLLEEKWVQELQKKYPVKVNEAVFKSMLK
ncbi:MAG TPA: peptidylprolyl isomerase [Ferruginibacter sp.]|nr:peptidylprolyl isomerase [Ferruginibacter sp.]HMP19613.1 peptidylprolyl isomerase [Ferruginibacter sp.]